jgi:acetoacetate decarboxylase
MVYKTTPLDHDKVLAGMGKLNVNLKWIPDVDGGPKIAQLVGYHLENIDLKFAFTGEARLHLVPHANCRLADLPVRKILYGQHLCADLTLPYGHVLHDYIVEK